MASDQCRAYAPAAPSWRPVRLACRSASQANVFGTVSRTTLGSHGENDIVSGCIHPFAAGGIAGTICAADLDVDGEAREDVVGVAVSYLERMLRQ